MNHGNVVRIYKYGFVEEGVPYIVMEYLRGGTLREHLAENGALNCREAVNLALQIAQALSAAHQLKIIHRDLKPENLILLNTDTGITVKLVDFGLSKIVRENAGTTVTSTAFLRGTVAYMSPEQCRSNAIDERSDIYSFACLLFEIITGFPPFRGESPGEILLKQLNEPAPRILELSPNCGLPKEMDLLISKCLCKEADKRYQSFAELIEHLLVLESLNSSASFKISSPLKEKRKQRVVWGVLAVSLTSIAFASFLFLPVFEPQRLEYRIRHRQEESIEKIPTELTQIVKQGKRKEVERLLALLLENRALQGWKPEQREELLTRCFDVIRAAAMPEQTFLLAAEVLDSALDRAGRAQRRELYIGTMDTKSLDKVCDYLLGAQLSQEQWGKLNSLFGRRKRGLELFEPKLLKPGLLRVRNNESLIRGRSSTSRVLWEYQYVIMLADCVKDPALALDMEKRLLVYSRKHERDLPREFDAHAVVGRLLLKCGKLEEAKKELDQCEILWSPYHKSSDFQLNTLVAFRREYSQALQKKGNST